MLTVLPRPPLHSLHRRLRPPGSYSAGRRHPVEQYDAGRPAPVRSTNPPPHFLHVNFSTYLVVGEQLVHRAGEGAYRQVVVDLAARAADQLGHRILISDEGSATPGRRRHAPTA
jgi:hypothetical protein